jgi:16S rRNA (uracil1498-N3)-methyltransferase
LENFLKNSPNYCLVGIQSSRNNLKELMNSAIRNVELIIGPEGDFSKKEYDLLKINKVRTFNLGKRRLRSETASLASLSILNSYME